MCLCMRPSFLKELDDLDIAGISVACVTEAVWCDDYEEMGE